MIIQAEGQADQGEIFLKGWLYLSGKDRTTAEPQNAALSICETAKVISCFLSVRYSVEKRCFNHLTLLWIDSLGSNPGKGSYADLQKTFG